MQKSHSENFDAAAFADRLRGERERLRLKQAEFAELGGVGRASQLFYESCERFPDTRYLENLARHGIDIPYLVTGKRTLPTFDEQAWLRFPPPVLWQLLRLALDIGRGDAAAADATDEAVIAAFKALCLSNSAKEAEEVLPELQQQTNSVRKIA